MILLMASSIAQKTEEGKAVEENKGKDNWKLLVVIIVSNNHFQKCVYLKKMWSDLKRSQIKSN